MLNATSFPRDVERAPKQTRKNNNNNAKDEAAATEGK